MHETKKVVVIGAGVSGLTTAIVLAQTKKYSVTIVAKHIPGDQAPDYTSPWAGANYLPVSEEGSRAAKWDEATFHYLWALTQFEPQTGVQITSVTLWNRSEDIGDSRDWAQGLHGPNPWFRNVMPHFRNLATEELPPGIESGTQFQTVCIDVPLYMKYLTKQATDNGVQIKSGVLDHVTHAVNMHHSGLEADVVVNCSGLMASKLGGVEDVNVFPVRGQMCLVKNKISGIFTTSGVDDVPSDTMYVMPRGREHTLIGGSYQKGSWNSEVDLELRERILKRAIDLCPELADGKGVAGLNIIQDIVGLRPARVGGTRLEKERIMDTWIVHNYGHGGYGYQSSYGCAQNVLQLVEEITAGKVS